MLLVMCYELSPYCMPAAAQPSGYFEVHLWMLVLTHVLDMGLLGAHREHSGSEFSTAFEVACCHMLFWGQRGG